LGETILAAIEAKLLAIFEMLLNLKFATAICMKSFVGVAHEF